MTSERHFALREGHCIGASDAYFKAWPTHDNDAGRMLFERGFVRGFDSAGRLYDRQHEAPSAAPAGQAAAPTVDYFKVQAICKDRRLDYNEVSAAIRDYLQQAPAAEAVQPEPQAVLTDLRGYASAMVAICDEALQAEAVQPTDAETAALGYATNLAVALHAKHYPEVAQWKPLGTVLGLLTQIDNMTCGLVKPSQAEAVQPAQAVRLTDAQVAAAFGWTSGHGPLESEVRYARIIERAVWAANNLRGE
jgi:hypothetical protein